MTPQQVIKSFMAKLVSDGNSNSTTVLDAAVKASSEYDSIQDVIDAMKADQIKAEKEAVEEVLGSDYKGKTVSEISSSILNADAKNYESTKASNAYLNSSNDQRTTVENAINERKAYIFLEKYCGIQLPRKYWYNGNAWTYWGSNGSTGNVDTGAITGSDANITLKAGDVVNGATLTAADLQSLALKDGMSLSGDTLIFGTGVEKTDRSVVSEIGNKYKATTSKAQNIQTGSNDWIVVATSYNDTILTGGADSISAGAGNDKITVGADYASITTGAGNDSIEISAEVQNVTINDLSSSDVLTISGTFEIGNAQIDDTMLIVTDKTGTRKIRLGNLDNAKTSKVNGTTLATWLSNAGFNINSLSTTSSNTIEETIEPTEPVTNGDDDGGRTAIDSDYTPSEIQPAHSVETENLPSRSASSTGQINVNLDNVTLTSGDLEIDGTKTGEISSDFPNISSFTKNGLTINLLGTTTSTSGDTNNIQTKTFSQLTTDQKTIVAGLFKWWAKECLKLNEESYGISFNSSTAMVKEIGLYFYDSNGSGNTLAAVWNWNSGNKTTKLMLNVNMYYYKGIASDNMDGESSVSGAGLLDRTLSHEFTHAIMATNVHYFNNLPKFIKEGMAELTHGIDDERGQNLMKNAYDPEWLTGSLDLTNTGTGTQTVGDGYSGGYMFLRYFARQAALQTIFDDYKNPFLIIGTNDADEIENTLSGATITALDGDDEIINNGDSVSIDAGAGDDAIGNGGSNVTITAGDGKDNITNLNSRVTMDAGAGDDFIINEGANSSINGGADADYIENSGSNVSIEAGAGADSISNTALNVTINGGDGEELIANSGENVSINGGTDDDYVYNEGSQVTINGGASNDYIINSGANVLFNYKAGDGNDLIEGFNETSTLSISGGSYTSIRSGNDLILTVGTGEITLTGAASLSALNINGSTVKPNPLFVMGTNEADSIEVGIASATIQALDGNDTIFNGHAEYSTAAFGSSTVNSYGKASVSIDAGDGDDWVSVYSGAAYSTIRGGAGNDTILNGTIAGGVIRQGSSYLTIDGGADDDYIFSSSNNISMNGGAGNDKIINDWGEDITIEGGDGDDTISSGRVNVLIRGGKGDDSVYGGSSIYEYANGDGNDTISGTPLAINITKGTISSSVVSGDNLVLKIGSGSITVLYGAKKNIPVVYGNYNEYWRDKKISNSTSNTIVSGGSKADSVHNSASKVTINAGAGRDTILNENWNGSGWNAKTPDSVSINAGDGDDVIQNDDGAQATLIGGKGNDNISNAGTKSSISGGDGNDTINNYVHSIFSVNDDETNGQTKAFSGSNSTIDAGDGNDYITNSTNDTSINGGDGNDTIVNRVETYLNLTSSDGVSYTSNGTTSYFGLRTTLNGGAGNDSIVNETSETTIIGGKGNDAISLSSAASLNVIQYASGDGNDLINGFNSTSTLSITGAGYSSETVGNDLILTVGSGKITLANGATLTALNIDGTLLSGTYTTPSGKALTVDNSVKSPLALDDDIVIVDASKRTKAIKITGNALDNSIVGGSGNDTLDGADGDDTLTGGKGNDIFVFNGGADVITDYDVKDKISIGGGLTYQNYAISGSDVILSYGSDSLTIKDGKDKAITFAGKTSTVNVYTADGIFNSNKTSATLASSTKTFTADTKLLTIDGSAASGVNILGNDKSNKIIAGNGSTLNGGKGTDTLVGGNGTDIFVFENKSGNKTIDGYSAGDKISLGAGVVISDVTLKKTDAVIKVGSNTLTVKNSSTVTLTADGKDSIFNGVAFVDNDSITLPATFAKAYTLSADVKNVDGSARSAAIKIIGNDKNNSIFGGSGNDTLDGLGGNDTLTGGKGNDIFVFNGGNDVITDYETADKISVSSELTYQNYAISGEDVILSYGSDSLTIKDGKDKAVNLNSVVRIYSTDGIFNSNKTSATLASSTKTFTADSKLLTIDGSNANAISILGNDKSNKIIAGNGSTLNGGKGTDTLVGGNGTDIFVYENKSGNKTIDNYSAGDKISLGSDVTISDVTLKKTDAVIKVGSNSITVKNNSAITFTDGVKETLFSGVAFVDGDSITLPATFAKAYTLGADVKNVDGSTRSAAIKIIGNDKNNSIFGGSGNDTLDGADGNDTLTGGKGNDIFVFNSGADVITDYDVKDKISVGGGLTYDDYAISGSDVILSYGDDLLTIKDGKDKAVNLNSVVRIYSTDGIFNSNKTSATLASSTKTFTADTKLLTIDGSNANAISILGNDKSNKIIAGNGSTLNGGKGTDTLVGGNGSDIFVYENKSGNKTIDGYSAGDKISLGAGVVISDVTLKKTDAIIKVGSNTLTVKNSSSVTLTADGKDSVFNGVAFVDNDSITLPATFAKAYTLSEDVKNVDGSARSAAIKITGNDKDNSIFGGSGNDTIYGEAGADTLWGGKGNDTLYGGDGEDTFIYNSGEGKDVIYGFENDDMLQITGDFSTSYNSSKNEIYFKVGSTSNAITLKNFTATSFNVNGETYHVSDKTLTK